MRDSKDASIISCRSKIGEHRYLSKVSLAVIVMILLILICVGGVFYFHWILGSEIVFTHFFYLPIVLAGFLWQRKGVCIAIFLGALLVVSHFLSGLDTSLVDDFCRFVMFAIVGLTVGILRGQALRSEEKLTETKQMLENIAQGITDGVLLISKDFKIIWANNAILKESGCSIEKVIANFCYKITHHCDEPCQPPHDICPIHEVLETGKPVTVFHTHFNEDGGEFYVEVNAYPVRDEKGEISQFVHVARDLTERVKAERELAESKDYTDNIISSMVDTLLVVDPDATIRTINQATSDLLGYAEEELIGQPVAKIFAEEEEEEEAMPFKGTGMKRLIDEGAVRDYDMKYHTKKGELIPVSFSGSVMRDKKGELIGIVGIARDMREIKRLMEKEKDLAAAAAAAAETDRKRAEELKEAYDKLSRTQAALVQSERLAALGQLGAGVAHELNSPLAGILELVRSFLKETNKADPNYSYFEAMKGATEHVAKIVADLTAFSRESEEEFEPLNINDAVEGTLSFSRHDIERKGIKVVGNLSEDLPLISGDRRRLQQVVLNMLTNARDAMAARKGRHVKEIVISTRRSKNRKSVELEFKDNGFGIARDHINRIFEPFFTTKDIGQGAGLGLSICHGIVTDHKGTIEVQSNVGRGTVFTVKLPVMKPGKRRIRRADPKKALL